MAKIYLTGIKPTGKLHLGNYIGVLKNIKKIQEEGNCIFFIADLHALTLPIEPETLKQNSIDIACFYLAAGLDYNKSILFLQSQVSEHAELNAILQNYLYMGELSRMTQFKDKTAKTNNNSIGVGIFTYPILMACDILLYNCNVVPVGEDQVQHVELTRTLATRFNNRYGETFVIPTAQVNKVGKRIMSLSDPTKKMSKSDPKGDIFLKDDLKTIRKKIMSAVTDLGDEVIYDPINKPGISNLLTIYASLKDISVEEACNHFKDCHRYGDFKKEVADVVCEEIGKLQERYNSILENKEYLKALEIGKNKAKLLANKTLNRVKKKVGFINE